MVLYMQDLYVVVSSVRDTTISNIRPPSVSVCSCIYFTVSHHSGTSFFIFLPFTFPFTYTMRYLPPVPSIMTLMSQTRLSTSFVRDGHRPPTARSLSVTVHVSSTAPLCTGLFLGSFGHTGLVSSSLSTCPPLQSPRRPPSPEYPVPLLRSKMTLSTFR